MNDLNFTKLFGLDEDKARELLSDAESEGLSICCGAKLYGDICADCKEHSGSVKDEE